MAHVEFSAGARGVAAMLQRAMRFDAASLARLRQRDEFVDVFVHTPFGVLASRSAHGVVGDGAAAGGSGSAGGVVVRAADLAALLGTSGDVGPADAVAGEAPEAQALWPGVLPPATGFVLLDQVPAAVVADLAGKGKELTRQFSTSVGPPASLLEQEVLRVRGGEVEVGVPMRMIFACVNLGFVPGLGSSADADVPRHLRVSALDRWVRLDAAYGTVWLMRGGVNLL